MDISLLSLIIFIIITILYFAIPSLGKPALTVAILNDPEQQTDFQSKTMKSLALYIGITIISQFFLNVGYLISKCGGSINKNIGSAAIFTFIPWLLIFGLMVAILIIFPGFKSAFSDVIGYAVVAGKAKTILNSILVNTDVNSAIEGANETDKSELTKTADALMKICGNKGILINQMNPENFIDIWNMLKPLMKKDTELSMGEKDEFRDQLLGLVVLKDNIGEGLWYIYTAILISSIVYYNLATKGCIKDVDQIKAERDAYIQQQEEADKQNEVNNSTTYTIS